MLALQDVQHLDAVQTAALQPDIEHDQMRPPLRDGVQRAIRIRGHARFIAVIGEDAGHQFAYVDFVVDHQDLRRDQRPVRFHASSPVLFWLAAAAETPCARLRPPIRPTNPWQRPPATTPPHGLRESCARWQDQAPYLWRAL